MIEPIIKDLFVPVTPDRAFTVFTQEMGLWWPLASHSLSASAGAQAKKVTIEPKVGGRIIEEMHDGGRADWGIVTAWEPGRKVGFTWHLRRLEAEQTHVMVEFSPDGAGTLVRLTHTGWDAQGEEAAANRAQYQSGWDFVLGECFAGAFVPLTQNSTRGQTP